MGNSIFVKGMRPAGLSTLVHKQSLKLGASVTRFAIFPHLKKISLWSFLDEWFFSNCSKLLIVVIGNFGQFFIVVAWQNIKKNSQYGHTAWARTFDTLRNILKVSNCLTTFIWVFMKKRTVYLHKQWDHMWE